MSDGDALLRTILERPDDDTARLVYADWLQENGREVHAQLIRRTSGPGYRNQVRRVAISNNNHRKHAYLLEDRWHVSTSNLCPKGTTEWVRASMPTPASGFDCSATIRAGFIESLWCPLGWFAEHAEALFRAHPIERMVLTDQRPLESSRFAWFNHPVPSGTSQPAQHRLPDELYFRLGGYDNRGGAHPKNVRWYNTRADAESALSRACVAYGRALAGLAPLPHVGSHAE